MKTPCLQATSATRKFAALGWAVLLGSALSAAGANRPTVAPAEPDFLAMSLEDLGGFKLPLVFAASKREQRQGDAPSSVSVITAQDIQHYGYRTLGDVLNSARGFYISNDRAYNFLGVRGFNRPGDYGGRNLLMVDGHRLNEALFDSTYFGNEFVLDVDLIDRVEVVRGPGSTLYGNNAFFSVVNVIPKRGQDFHWGEVSITGGHLGTAQGRFTLGRQLENGFEFLFSGTSYQSRGERRIKYVSADPTQPLPNDGVAENLDDERARSFFAQLRFGNLTLSGALASRAKSISSDPYLPSGGVFNDPQSRVTDQPSYLDLKFEREFEGDWAVLARLGYNRYDYHSPQQFDYAGLGNPADYTVNFNQTRSQAISGEVQVGRTILDRHVITAGAEFRDLFDNFYRNEDLNPAVTYLSINPRQWTWGVFANTELQLYRRNLTLHLGARYDGFSDFAAALSPRAALIAHPSASTTFKFNYGQAYRTPNVYESVYNASFDVPGVGAPQPEKIRTNELIWEQDWGSHFRTSVNGYWNQISNLIDTDPLRDRLVNLGKVNGHGVEFEIEGRAASGLRGQISYALQRTRDTVTAQNLGNSPEHLAKFNVAAPLHRDKLFAGLELQYRGAVHSVYGTRVEDFWLLNTTLFGHTLIDGLEITASVQNLLDQRYAFPGSAVHAQAELPQPGRSLRVKVTFKF